MKRLVLDLNIQEPNLSKVKADGELITNIHAISVRGDIHTPFEVELGTYGDQISVTENPADLYIRPKCPHCGFDGERHHAYGTNKPDGAVSKVSAREDNSSE